ncbi:tetratricopeptide repeat protein [Rubinisphaera italica]|uniref:Uncharacterized protein n=1 Tax=Rubinisphaera italica TaxID=2527969 RepID=A0A5C5XJH5_9PLAN|nr:hypothetical protein [Rubinisphaera italica]TWT63347.1 hypothetical protein Pan54_41000 [Rubinisphaera italica]
MTHTIRTLFCGVCLFLVISSTSLSADEKPPIEKTEAQTAAAQKSFELGKSAMELEDFETAIEHFEAAVKVEAENGEYHHALGLAYMANRNANAGWYHFRMAVRYAPKNEAAVMDFLRTWKFLDDRGLFSVGTTADTIMNVLGKPDQFEQNGIQSRAIYGFMSINMINQQVFSILDLRNLPEGGLRSEDGLAFSLPEGWRVAYRILSFEQGNTEFTKGEETIQNWTELFSSQRFIGIVEEQSAKKMMEIIRESLTGSFKEVEFDVLNETPDDVLFFWRIKETDEHPSQYEMVRIVKGKSDIHRIAYTKKADQKDEENIKLWTETLRSARLMTAEELRKYQQQAALEHEILQATRFQLQKQEEYIRDGNIEELKKFILPEKQNEITPELLKKIDSINFSIDEQTMVKRVELKEEDGKRKARIFNSKDEQVLTLIEEDNTWYATELWFVKLAGKP